MIEDMGADRERDELLDLLRTLRVERDRVADELSGIDGRKWDAMVRLRELGTPHSMIAAAWGVTGPAVIQAVGRPRPQPATER